MAARKGPRPLKSGGPGSPSSSPKVKSARSPGGTRVVDVTVTSRLGGGNGAMTDDEAERLRRWKAQLAAEESDEDFGKGAESDDEAGAVLAKFGVGSPGKPQEQFNGEFKWDGFQQVHTITEQNQQLMAMLGEKDAEIERLQDVIVATEPIPGLDPDRLLDLRMGTETIDADARDLKIMELAKKTRALNLQLQREKAKSAGLAEERNKYKDIAETKVYPQRLKPATSTGKSEAETTAEALQAEKNKSRMLSSRLNEYRVKADRYEQEVKKARAALRREVGQKANLEEIIEQGGNWRGRAQKIVMLKAKVKELQSQVSEHNARADVDYQAKAEIKAMERERMRAVESITEEFEQVQQQTVVYKRKMEAAKARSAVLERDVKKAKDSIQTLLKKTSTDDQLIDALRTEVAESRRRLGQMNNDLNSTRASLARTTSVEGAQVLSADEFERLSRQNKERGRQLEHQEKILTSLRSELRAARKQGQQGRGGGSGSGAPRPQRPSSAEMRSQARMQSEYNEANLKMLQLDNAKQSELVNLLKRKVQDAEANAEAAITRAQELDALCANYEQELGQQRNGRPARTSRKATPKATAALQGQVHSLQEEIATLRRTYRKSLQARDEEISMLQDQMARVQRQFSTQLDRFREQASGHGGAGRMGVGGGSGGADVAQLREDNEVLRREVTDLRAKYQQLNVRYRHEPSGQSRAHGGREEDMRHSSMGGADMMDHSGYGDEEDPFVQERASSSRRRGRRR